MSLYRFHHFCGNNDFNKVKETFIQKMDIVMIAMFLCMYIFFLYYLFEDIFIQEQKASPVKYIFVNQHRVPVSQNVYDDVNYNNTEKINQQ